MVSVVAPIIFRTNDLTVIEFYSIAQLLSHSAIVKEKYIPNKIFKKFMIDEDNVLYACYKNDKLIYPLGKFEEPITFSEG